MIALACRMSLTSGEIEIAKFVTSMAWPSLILFVVLRFRTELSELIRKIKSFEWGQLKVLIADKVAEGIEASQRAKEHPESVPKATVVEAPPLTASVPLDTMTNMLARQFGSDRQGILITTQTNAQLVRAIFPRVVGLTHTNMGAVVLWLNEQLGAIENFLIPYGHRLYWPKDMPRPFSTEAATV